MSKPKKPKLSAVLSLSCLYCDAAPLRRSGSFWRFVDKCPHCGQQYDREEGYYSGVPWVISYPLCGALGIALVLIFAEPLQQLATVWIVTIVSCAMVMVSLATYPYAKALWIYLDHRFHPPDPGSSPRL